MEADTCRLCLRPIDKAKSTDLATESTKLAMLKEFLPEVKLDIAQNTQICYSCLQDLEVSYNFKQGVLVNEATIQAKLEENDLKNIDLRIMLDDFAKKEVKPDDFICRTCFSICETPSISLFDAPSNMMPCSFVKKMCQLVFELEFITSDKPVLCDDCWNTLQTVYNFRKCCIKTDKKLLAYIAKMNLTKVTIAEFKTFAKEDLPNDNDEYSSDDELGTHVKEELVDEDELKFNPDEASCSSGSFKVKEETAVKCESDLNSEDENIKDEPEYLDLKAVKSEASELEGEDCKMEIGEVKVDAEGDNSAGPSGKLSAANYEWYHDLEESFVPVDVPKLDGPDNRSIDVPKFNHDLEEFLESVYIPMFQYDLAEPLRFVDMPKLRHDLEEFNDAPKYSSALSQHSSNCKSHLELREITHQQNNAEQVFSCTQCTYSAKSDDELKVHLRTHIPVKVVKVFRCTECSFETKFNNNLKRHKRRHIPLQNNSSENYQCAQCSFKCKYSKNLSMHMKLHNSVKLLNCDLCSFKTFHKTELIKHSMSHSIPDELFNCSQCGFESKYKRSLKRHIFSKHNE